MSSCPYVGWLSKSAEGEECPFAARRDCIGEEEELFIDECLGEIGCVSVKDDESGRKRIKVNGSFWPASSKEELRPGQWVRVTGISGDYLEVMPLAVWIASCCS
ncbi:MAG: NfeD family protein [Candidatus Altiarchaeota archaeon]